MQGVSSAVERNQSNTNGIWGFSCRYCSRKFPTSQAIAGHQKAHRFDPKWRKSTRHERVFIPKERFPLGPYPPRPDLDATPNLSKKRPFPGNPSADSHPGMVVTHTIPKKRTSLVPYPVLNSHPPLVVNPNIPNERTIQGSFPLGNSHPCLFVTPNIPTETIPFRSFPLGNSHPGLFVNPNIPRKTTPLWPYALGNSDYHLVATPNIPIETTPIRPYGLGNSYSRMVVTPNIFKETTHVRPYALVNAHDHRLVVTPNQVISKPFSLPPHASLIRSNIPIRSSIMPQAIGSSSSWIANPSASSTNVKDFSPFARPILPNNRFMQAFPYQRVMKNQNPLVLQDEESQDSSATVTSEMIKNEIKYNGVEVNQKRNKEIDLVLRL